MRRLVLSVLLGAANLIAFLSTGSGQTKQAPAATPTPQLKFSYGQWWNGCGPTDLPTSGITLATVRLRCNQKKIPVPRITVQLASSDDKSATITIEGMNHQKAQAWRCLNENAPCEVSMNGTISLSGPKATYELKFADGSVEKGTFSLTSCFQKITCW